jgi:hypothetical protein
MLQQDQKTIGSMRKMTKFYEVRDAKYIYAFIKICNPWPDGLYLGLKD